MKWPLTATQIKWLHHDLCVEVGLLLTREQFEIIEASERGSIDEFTDVILIEEGLSPEKHRVLRAQVKRVVDRHFAAAKGSGN